LHDVGCIGINANPPVNKATTKVFENVVRKSRKAQTSDEEDEVDMIRYFVEPFWALSWKLV